MTTYPEHDKLRTVVNQSQSIGEFLDWVRSEKGFFLAEYEEDWHSLSGCALPAHYSTTNLLAEFFNIDLQKIEDEKRAMLHEMRTA